ncbi:hypothetical protein C9426_35225 [Serratia sp. S1B]|nr:hypothetical protein C9426_35225 [Serratia sp. S1B]
MLLVHPIEYEFIVDPSCNSHVCNLGELGYMLNIFFILQAAWVLAALHHPSHIVSYVPGDYEPHS